MNENSYAHYRVMLFRISIRLFTMAFMNEPRNKINIENSAATSINHFCHYLLYRILLTLWYCENKSWSHCIVKTYGWYEALYDDRDVITTSQLLQAGHSKTEPSIGSIPSVQRRATTRSRHRLQRGLLTFAS